MKKAIANRPWILAENTLKMYRRAPMEVAALPVGSTEPHNLHLPLGADSYQVELAKAKITPDFPY